MATDLTDAPDETGIGEINKYDFVTPTHGVFKAERGSEREHRLRDFGDESASRRGCAISGCGR